MPRKRMIDPSIWINEDFGMLSTLGKLIFIGLFSNADDEGRGKANPAYIKAVLFPYNDDLRISDVEKTLKEISSKMSVIFYSCDGNMYYTLTSWNTFQKIDKPKESKITNYDEENPNIRLLFGDLSTTIRRPVAPNRKERNKKRIEKEHERKKREYIVKIYNKYCFNLPNVQKITDKRKSEIDNFLKEFNLKQFRSICKKANLSDFLTGNNKRKWKADFEFLMRIDKATSIMEGKYEDKGVEEETNGRDKRGAKEKVQQPDIPEYGGFKDRSEVFMRK